MNHERSRSSAVQKSMSATEWRGPSSMAMPVVRVGHVAVAVLERRVLVPVRMRFAGRIAGPMRMLVMVVVAVGVLVRERGMDVAVRVLLGDMQPHAHRHQAGGGQELDGDRLAERGDSDGRTEERRGREVGAGARRAEMAQRQHEQREAEAIAQHADQRGGGDRSGGGQRIAYAERQGDVDRAGDQALELDDNHIAGPGSVGVWTKADSVTIFDGFTYQAAP